MEPDSELAELIRHLAASSSLSPPEAQRVVADVLAFLSESTEEFVRRRHRELQRSGMGNPAIFEQIAHELDRRRVRPPRLSARQLRRLVYG